MVKPIALTLAMSLSALASTSNAAPAPGEWDISAKCPELSLVANQKEQLKTIFEQTKAKLQTQKKALVETKKALVASLADVNATQDVVVGHQTNLKAGVDAILDTVFGSVNQITFTVLQKEQRPQAVACFQKVKKEWRQKWLEKKCSTRGTPSEESDIDTELGEL